ncbi:MAG: L-aspartate oxidase [Clostridia bacterium]|nr:L-aspartate oxidase [Clostridia bacterium]
MKTADILIIGTGVSGLYCALNLPKDKDILIITKDICENSDSFLAQGGICVLKDESDYDSYFEDTMKAGHYENRRESVDIMIRSSPEIIGDLVRYGVRFEKDADGFLYTREGAHSTPRILFHEDITGEEITSHLLAAVRTLPNVTIMEHTMMCDLIIENDECIGITAKMPDDTLCNIYASQTVLATGGVGGLYVHSTNYRHLTGDALGVCMEHDIKLENIDYVQIHPTSYYMANHDRRFLISESVRGEGAVLLDKNGERFTDELQPRDVVTAAIRARMEKDGTAHVMLSLKNMDEEEIRRHFPHIYEYCKEHGVNLPDDPIPVVPAQHYFMGGVWVDSDSKTSCRRLYAVGEASCNGVHGRNRLASNSLLESLVFAKRAARHITENGTPAEITDDIIKKNDLKLGSKEDFLLLRDDYTAVMRSRIEEARRQREMKEGD